MYRLMIVEDEEIEREALRDLIDWASMGIEVAAVFENGDKALAYARKEKIDILLTDIRMIGMTGLELAKQLLELDPGVKVIITSGYQEFEYAKTAIDLDAYGFLSKPVDMEELEKVFSRVISTCRVETESVQENTRLKLLIEQSKPLLKEKFLKDLVDGTGKLDSLAEDLRFYNIGLGKEKTAVLLSEIDGFGRLGEEKSREELLMIIFKVLECLQSISSGAETFYLSEGKYCTLYNTENATPKELHEKAMEQARKLQKKVNERCRLELTVGIGEWVRDLTDIPASFKKACEAARFKFFMGSNQIIHYKDTYFSHDIESNYNLDELENRILSAVQLCDRESLNTSLAELFEIMRIKSMNTDSYARTICVKLIARVSILLHEMHESYEKIFGKEHFIWDKILKFDTIPDIRLWMKNILGSVVDYIDQGKKSSNKKVIQDILKFIEGNYSKNITLTDVSKEIFLSYNYISIIFKKEIGESFSDFLAKYRLEKAKQLLKESNLKVYQISNMVGYNNISHFCSIFKSFYGVSPSEFREKV